MPDIPFAIPESLASYVIQYESAPDKTIRRLNKQLEKRGPDPVGYFLLGWFYYRKGLQDEAVECALKAKNFAPGSPFMNKLHYFFSHPQLFDAWQHHGGSDTVKGGSYEISSGPIYDLDNLIQKLSSMKTRRMKSVEDEASNFGSSLTKDSDDVDDIVSETLAKIHEQQGKTGAAIETYKKLLKHREDKGDYYREQIERLEKKKDQDSEK